MIAIEAARLLPDANYLGHVIKCGRCLHRFYTGGTFGRMSV